MSLLQLQSDFRSELAADDDGALPSSQGMAVYRNAYRGRLLGALESSFARTRQWVGGEGFTVAACHYVISNPPRGWTLDDYGADFPELLSGLFGEDPEVSELAWLEWHMQRAFAAPDVPALFPADLISARYSEAEWAGMTFAMASGFIMRHVTTNCSLLWERLADGDIAGFEASCDGGAWLAVWRKGITPNFRVMTNEERSALAVLADGGRLEEAAGPCDASRLGTWLVQWLEEGIFSDARPAEPNQIRQ